jgi:uncharacterized SAM-binding protein YcdF (DUF218 family)
MVLVCFWVFGLFQFVGKIPIRVVDDSSRTDAIVVLTGGSLRLVKGLDLLAQGLSKNLFISGVYRGVDVRELLKILKREKQQIENQISIGIAVDTKGNAVETKAWMTSNKVRSLRLVTADYHMPRSLFEFETVLPKENIVAHPVFPDKVKRVRWWAWPGTASLLISEYNKLLFAWVRNEISVLSIFAGTEEEKSFEAIKRGTR